MLIQQDVFVETRDLLMKIVASRAERAVESGAMIFIRDARRQFDDLFFVKESFEPGENFVGNFDGRF